MAPTAVPVPGAAAPRDSRALLPIAAAHPTVVLIPVLGPGPALIALVDALLDGARAGTDPAPAADGAGADDAAAPLLGGIVVVDDGSGPGSDGLHDRLCAQLRTRGVLVHRLPQNRGKGAALREGLALSAERFPGAPVVTADADGQHLPRDILALARVLQEEPASAQLVLGTRTLGHGIPLRSRVGNTASTLLLAVLTGRWLPDTQSGLRGIPPALIPWLLAQPGDRYEYEMRTLMALAADRTAPRLRTVPATTVYEEGNPTSRFRPVRDSLRVMRPVAAFLLTCGLSAAVDIGLFLVLLGAGLPAAGAVVAARLASGALNFVLNRALVFRDATPWPRAAGRYLLLALGVGAGAAVLTQALVLLGVPAAAAKILADLLLMIVSFCRQRACAVPRGSGG